MKYISTYKFFESKNVGILYHFTSFINLIKIINSNKLIGQKIFGHETISFTRDKNYIENSGAPSLGDDIQCRIVFDGDKLSNKYKIRPYNYYSDPKLLNINPESYFNVARPPIEFNHKLGYHTGTESEEQIQTKEILNIKNYIIRVDLIEKEFFFARETNKEEVLNLLNQNGIKFEYFQPY